MRSVFVAVVLFFAVYANAISSDQIKETIDKSIHSAQEILADEALDKDEKADKLYAMFDPFFNYALMARLSLGNHWNNLSSDERKIFTQSFEKKLKNSYISTLTQYSDEVIEIVDLTKQRNRLHLNTLIYSNGGEYEVVYKFYEASDDDWLIYDMDILGVSIVQSFRNQFAGHSGSFDELLALLENNSI